MGAYDEDICVRQRMGVQRMGVQRMGVQRMGVMSPT